MEVQRLQILTLEIHKAMNNICQESLTLKNRIQELGSNIT